MNKFTNNRQAAAWMIRMGRKLLQSNVPISPYISRSDNNHNFDAGHELIYIGQRIAMGYELKEFTHKTYMAHVIATRPVRSNQP